MIYRSNGAVEVESNDMTVFDLWALSSYIKMRADEMYINVQAIERAKHPQIVTATAQPRKPGRLPQIRQ